MKHAPVPPQNLDAEESVLGAMMLSPVAIDAVSEVLRPEDMYRGSHGVIYRAALALHARGEPVDAITLVDELDRDGTLKEAGGRSRVYELAALVPASANAAHYARLVRDAAVYRDLIRAGGEVARLGWEHPSEPETLLDLAQQLMFTVGETRLSTVETIAEQAKRTREHMQAIAETPDRMTGTPSGFHDLDRITHGFQPGNLVILAARPGMGKSALALEVARHNALGRGQGVFMASLEMSAEELLQRLYALEAGVDVKRLRTGRATSPEWTRVFEAEQKISRAPLVIDDNGLMKPLGLRSRVRREKARRGGLGLVIVDYLQLMVDGKAENRVQETTRVSRELKVLARDLEVPVLALAQLNRQVEYRPNKRPQLADLRDSGAIEQDADVVLFLYRDEVYNPNSATKGMAELQVAKHRNGDTGLVELTWSKGQTRFGSLARPAMFAA